MSTAKESALFSNILGAFKELNCQVIRSGASFTVGWNYFLSMSVIL